MRYKNIWMQNPLIKNNGDRAMFVLIRAGMIGELTTEMMKQRTLYLMLIPESVVAIYGDWLKDDVNNFYRYKVWGVYACWV